MGTPLTRPDQIVDAEAVALAVDALLYGTDEPRRDTTAQGWSKLHYDEGRDAMKMWYEELADYDKMISENVEVPLTPLPTAGLLAKVEESADRLSTWYAAAVPVFQKRMLHIHYDELAEIAGDLRGGKINAAEADARYQAIMADVAEIEGFSKFMGS
jgi:hypothetical protein